MDRQGMAEGQTMSPAEENCKNCGADFSIDGGDGALYAKLGVPAPTWCRECRLMRKMAWRIN